MKKLITVSFAAGFLAICPSTLMALDQACPSTNAVQYAALTQTAAERKAQMRQVLDILGITRKDLNGLTREDRRAKIRSAAENMVVILRQKKAAGTITGQELANLETLRHFLHHHKVKATSGN